MLPKTIDNFEFIGEVSGWECGRGQDTLRNQPIGIKRFVLDPTIPQEALQEYLRCLHELRENPHPNLVTVLEFGIENDQLLVVTEWVEAEDLTVRTDQGVSLVEVMSMSVSISKALQHVHSCGIVYRTFSPVSVLIAAESQAVCLDVPLWKLRTSTSLSEAELMFAAPEVLSNQQFSTASDIYATGVVLYSTLVGDFPWTDENGAPRVRVEEDAVPRLPPTLSTLQRNIDDMLVFDAQSRTLSYEEFKEFIAEGDDPSNLNSNVMYRSGLIDTAEVNRVTQPLDRAVGTGGELTTGRSRFWLYSTLSAIAVVGLLASLYAFTNFDTVRMVMYEIGLAEHPELSERWLQAESLRLDQNQSLITLIAAYNRVLELVPDHNGAHTAIDDEKKKRREKIETLINSDELVGAQARLDEYVTAVPNDAEIALLVTELENRQRRDRLLADARPLVAAGIEDPALLDAAVLAYQTVLRVFPDSEEARRHLNDIAVMYVEAAIKAANESEIEDARDFFEKAKEADPDVQELEAARERVELAETLETEINTTLRRATTHFEEGRLITPTGEDNSMSTFRQVLALDVGNELAKAKLNEIEEQIIEMHQELLEERNFGAEAALVLAARRAGVSATSLQEMSNALLNLKQDIADASQLYTEAWAQFQNGYISRPANNNAIEILQQAQRKDTKNVEVQELLTQCAERTAAVAQEAFLAGLTDRAKEYLLVALEIQPMNDSWAAQYQQWEQLDQPNRN